LLTLSLSFSSSYASLDTSSIRTRSLSLDIPSTRTRSPTCRTTTIDSRYQAILATKHLQLNGTHSISYSHDRDMLWTMNPLPTHPNGMRFSVFDAEGTLMATNEFYSVGGGFVVNEQTQVDENLYYRGIHKEEVDHARRDQTHGLPPDALLHVDSKALPPIVSGDEVAAVAARVDAGMGSAQLPYLFRNAAGLIKLTQKHNVRPPASLLLALPRLARPR